MSAGAAPAPPAGIDELRALTRDLLGHDTWPRERLIAHQRERLRATLRKETLVERFDDFVTDPRLSPTSSSRGGCRVATVSSGSDVVTTAPGPGPAGRPYRRLASVEGRSSDVLELPGLRGGTVAVHPFRLGRPLAAFPDVRQFQLGRDGAAIVMEVVLRPRAGRDVPGRLRTAIVHELEAAGAVAPPVAVEAVPAIARETGPGAKLKLVRAPR